MKAHLIKLFSAPLGLFSAFIIGTSFEISNIAIVTWIWVFFLGLGTKVLIQGFSAPFMNISTHKQVPGNQISHLDILRTIFLYIGTGLLIGELLFNGQIGAISIAFLIYGTSIHIGTHYLNMKGWYFNQ